MEGTLGRTCLVLALLGALLAVTLSVNPGARAEGAAAAHAGTMPSHGAPEAEENEKVTGLCELEDPPRPLKQELAFLLADDPELTDRKNFIASLDGIATKSKD